MLFFFPDRGHQRFSGSASARHSVSHARGRHALCLCTAEPGEPMGTHQSRSCKGGHSEEDVTVRPRPERGDPACGRGGEGGR